MMNSNDNRKSAQEINEGRFQRRLAHNMSNTVVGDKDCWIWGSTCFKRSRPDGDKKLIPYFTIQDTFTRMPKQVYARRWAWEHKYGPLEKGTSVVNVCGDEKCVRPDPRHNRALKQGSWLPHEDQLEAKTEEEVLKGHG